MRTILYISLFSFLLSSCEDVVYLDLPNGKPLLVVDGEISDWPGKKFLSLSYSIPYDEQGSFPVEANATIRLFEDSVEVDMYSADSIPGLYSTTFTGTTGHEYYIIIETMDGKTFHSLPETINRVPEIDSIYAPYIDFPAPFEDGYYVLFDTWEPAGAGDCYRWKQYINGQYLSSPFYLLVRDDRIVDGNNLVGFQISFEPLLLGDTFYLEQMSITNEAYKYWTLVVTQTAQVGSNFDPPPAPVVGNIRNSSNVDELVLGYFSAVGIRGAGVRVN